jgi:hypothetical protein
MALARDCSILRAMPAFPEFRRAVHQRRTAVTRRLRQHTGDWTRVAALPEWRQNSDGAYRIEREPLVWDDQQVHHLTLIPQWNRIEEVVSSSSQLQAHFGHAVVYDFMRKGYDARSRIAHGGEPTQAQLKFKE